MIFIYWEWPISIEATKICYFGLALFGIGSHPTRLPDVSDGSLAHGILILSWYTIEPIKDKKFNMSSIPKKETSAKWITDNLSYLCKCIRKT